MHESSQPIQVLLIDHEDSFTFNIKAWLEKEPKLDVRVVDWNDPILKNLGFLEVFSLIVLSPGPGEPRDYPSSLVLLEAIPAEKPVLGICLGMQMMLELKGICVQPLRPVHGKSSRLVTSGHAFFSGMKEWVIGRYHSLGTCQAGSDFEVLARSEDGIVMAIEDKELKQLGVQFHPESFLTEKPDLLRDFLVRDWLK